MEAAVVERTGLPVTNEGDGEGDELGDEEGDEEGVEEGGEEDWVLVETEDGVDEESDVDGVGMGVGGRVVGGEQVVAS